MSQTDNYRPRQNQRDADYRREYAAWLASLTPDELARVKAAGLGEPVRDDSGLDSIEPACDQSGYQAQRTDAEQVWDVVRRLLGELLVQKNAKLALECLALASGVSFLGDSMTEIARRHGLTRAAVSKRCVELARKIGLPPSRAMRSLKARTAYAQARQESLRRHDR
jgi:transposase-like protein